MSTFKQLGTAIIGYGGIASLLCFKDLKKRIGILLAMYMYGKMKGGAEHSILYSLYGINKPQYYIRGYVKPGYEKVKQVFEQNFIDGMERASQCCVYVKGEKVVDLVGTTHKSQTYTEDSLQVVYSSSKVMSTIVIAMLVDRGYLKYDQKIVDFWPEFGQHGKENITLDQILRHEAGLASFTQKPTTELAQRDKLKQNSIGKIIEEQKPKLYTDNESNREYHAVTRGLILNEIVRRVDPKKRTIGEFIQAEVNGQMGVEYHLGIEENKLSTVSELSYTLVENPLWPVFQSMVPSFMGRKILLNFFQLLILYGMLFALKMFQAPFDLTSKEYKHAEYPSSNGITNARTLAKIAAAVSMGGKLGNTELFSEKTCQEFHSEPTIKYDRIFRRTSKFNKGGNNIYSADQQLGRAGDTYGFVGWGGMGGSMIQWHTELQIGFGYAMNLCEVDQSFIRGSKLRRVVYECARDMDQQSKQGNV